MELAKQVFGNGEIYSVVDVYNKRKYHVSSYLKFLRELPGVNHLAEMPMYPSPVIVDFDCKTSGTEAKELFSEQVVEEVFADHAFVISKEVRDAPDRIVALVMKKAPRVVDGATVKHGFHLHFPFIVFEKTELKHLHEMVKSRSRHAANLDDVYNKPWLLYGSSKSPSDLPYLVSHALVYESKTGRVSRENDWESVFAGVKLDKETVPRSSVKNMIRTLLSIRVGKIVDMQKQYSFENMPEAKANNAHLMNEPAAVHVNISDEKIGNLVMCLKSERAEDYGNWLKVGMILASLARSRKDAAYFRNLFHIFSRQSPKYNDVECEAKFDSLIKSSHDGGLGIGTLVFMAKEDNAIKDLSDILFNYCLEFIPLHDYDIAKMVIESVTARYITHKDFGCYAFEGTIWKEVTGWDNIFKNHVNEWAFSYIRTVKQKITSSDDPEDPHTKSRMAILTRLEKKVKNYSSMNNIVKSMFDQYFDHKMYLLFEQNTRFIAFNNCVFDIEEWKLVPANPDHYLSIKIHHDLVEWESSPQAAKQFVEDFFYKIFPDDELREYCLDNFARIITGKNVYKQFQFWTGTGNNGKSVCINLMEAVFGKMSMKTPKSIVMGGQVKQGGAAPETYRLKDARLGIIDEVTNNDYLDPGQIKGLSGNDTFYSRDLFQKCKDIKEITPMFFPILITNETPIIKRPDDATWDRIRLIRFESKFKSDVVSFIKNNPGVDHSKVFKADPQVGDKLKKNAKYFLAFFMSRLLKADTIDEFNSGEVVPDKVNEGLHNFKSGQNIMRRFLEENFIVDPVSQEVYSLNKIMKEYNATRPKVVLSLEETLSALDSYSAAHPGMVVVGNTVKGLSRIIC
ncbi:DNA primase [Diadromus pulchellus ascovirus 4a]|uniref:Complete DpAV4 genome n=1 Tax=Diadromus pulchellus ascovirus 4a TaxID=158683 RepID=F2NZ22_9VIRU|nr:DNA primase [Diadromus pulchellus ascovirus 4a]CCA61450.1 unnamed protein product [Diadromus pulchellus ascovirus 4a]